MYAAKLPGCIVDDVIDVVDDHLQYFSRGLDYFQIFLKIFSTIFRGGGQCFASNFKQVK